MPSRGEPTVFRRTNWSSIVCQIILLLLSLIIFIRRNAELQGLYQSGYALFTQCKAECFVHITYCLDRPDVLANFIKRIIADKEHYPLLLSNDNRIID